MSRTILQTKPANTRLIYYVLIFGFAMLLSSLWYIGNFSTEKLSELRSHADERTQDYTKRLALAVDLRAEADSVIAEARLFRATRDELRIGGPPFKSRLKEAKFSLDRLLEQARELLKHRSLSMPADERAAWERLDKSAESFWQILQEEEQRPAARELADVPFDPLATPGSLPSESPAPPAAPVPPGLNGPPLLNEMLQKRRDFYAGRGELSQAARALAKVLIDRQQTALEEIKDLQTQAATEVNGRWWWTYLVSWGVAIATYVLTQRQVHQIREAKSSAQEAEGLTTSVLNSLSNDVLAFNEQGAVLTVNPAFLRDFKLSREESLQQDYRTLLSRTPELRAYIEEATQTEEVKTKHREHLQIKPVTEGEDTRLFNVDVAPRFIRQEQRGHVVVLTDVTEAERIREEASRNRTLSTVGQLTAQVAHEIYNPLGAIKLNVDLLEMQLGEEENDVKHTVARLKRGLEHLSTIVMDLRYITRPREPERRPTEMNALLDEVIELAGDRLERSRVTVKRDYAAERLLGDFDPLQLRKVFLNLLINAVEASPRAGEIELRTRMLDAQAAPAKMITPEAVIAVSVIDHGTGMSPETKRRVFEAFYSTKQHGTGLGMMITQEIIKKHGGQIEIESEEGKGTMVSVYLPV
jgi:nitrogen-specific signal transduction histidine kinase